MSSFLRVKMGANWVPSVTLTGPDPSLTAQRQDGPVKE
jgi:hypothetical protein